ncbi:MAG: sulfatase [Verrucomicrobiales bacterium]|nr:sulfatase [Verrucomicrobiales bacterium]
MIQKPYRCPWRLARLIGFSTGVLALSAATLDARPPNFIFVMVDDLGWTDLGCQGSKFYETPHIDRLAREGMRFTQAYAACTVCSPTRAALMTGKYPARLHITDWITGHVRPYAKLRVPDWRMFLPHEERTIAEVLRDAGYATASIGKWHLGGPDFYPQHHGFDVNIGGFDKGSPPSYFSPYNIPTLADGPPGEFLSDRLTDEAVRFIQKHRDRPFFIYLPHYAVHTPLMGKSNVIARYQAKADPKNPHHNAVYAALIESVDDSVGRILQTLEALQLADCTVIFFTSDNGGLIGPARRRVTSNVPLRAGKGSAYEGGVRVPLLVKWPGVTRPGSVCETPVITPDYYPTMLEMAGLKPARSQIVDGVSLVPLLRGRGLLRRDAIYWHYPHYHPGGATPYGAVREGDWKLIEFFEDNRVELYNLRDDIGESRDQAVNQPDLAKRLREKLHRWRAKLGAQMPTPNPDYDPARADASP